MLLGSITSKMIGDEKVNDGDVFTSEVHLLAIVSYIWRVLCLAPSQTETLHTTKKALEKLYNGIVNTATQ